VNRLAGRVALVTGAGAGLGRATCLAFASGGAAVIVADRDAEGAAETVSLIEREGGSAVSVETDVTRASDCESMVAEATSRFGRLDFAYNNAGMGGEGLPTHGTTLAHWDALMAVNLTGVFLSMKYEIPAMLESGAQHEPIGAAIVNTSSIRGLVSYPDLSAYTASKHAVFGLTKSAALEYADKGIRINAVCPGVVKTALVKQSYARMPGFEERSLALHPVGRFGEPGEIAATVVWLCSDEASYVTGAGLVVDGGWVAQ
jgi:NAD(P)-dependent dehydrogenase (short-subunit alcohol dehydrogenase family)